MIKSSNFSWKRAEKAPRTNILRKFVTKAIEKEGSTYGAGTL